jgi:menaquinone-specific isochorismate synthase
MARRDRQQAASDRTVERAISRVRPVEECPPSAALRAFTGPRFAWAPPEEPTLVGCDAAATVTADGPDRFRTVRETGRALFRACSVAPASGVDGPVPDVARPRLLGGFAFHDEHRPDRPWRGFPGARFVLPRVQVTAGPDRTWLTVTDAGPEADAENAEAALERALGRIREAPRTPAPPPGIASTRRTPTRDAWRRQVESAVARIREGDLAKVVLAQALTADLRAPFRLADTLERLADSYPDCFRFAVDPGVGATFFGATPERLVRLDGRAVRTEALAGSIGRGATPEEDARLAGRLRGSEKARIEHDLVAEAVRDQVASLDADVRVGERRLRKLANVQHLHTPIEATLRGDAHVLDIAERLHPTPAVGGLPPAAAWRTIKETETFERGWYAAPVGWFDADGDGAFAVGIRSAVAAEETATLFAGNGIVADSDPDAEWEELQLKYRPMLDQLR